MAALAGPVVVANAVSKEFHGVQDVTVLTEISLRLDPAASYAITGRSGAGKSTLLNLLGLIELPTSGRLTVCGVDPADASERDLTRLRSRSIGFVFQSFHLVDHLTTLENVALPLRYQAVSGARRRERAFETLEQVGLTHRASAFPTTLSGGERQRVAVARAIVHRPPLVLCDEPTGNLDADNGHEIVQLLQGLTMTGSCVVVVTHDREVAAALDHRLVLERGALRTDESPDAHRTVEAAP